MEPAKLIAYGALILLAVLAVSKASRVLAPLLVIVYGLFIAPIVRSWYAFQDKYLMRYDDAQPETETPFRLPGNAHSEALEGTPEDDREWVSEGLELTKEQWLTFLAKSAILDSEGLSQPFTKAKLAALVGVRAEDANKVIDVARGVEARVKVNPNEPQFEQVGNRQQFVRTNAKPIR